jgi:endo-beta-N-acetylglucosaminidase D
LLLALCSYQAEADIQPDSPPFALSVQQLKDWSSSSDLASVANISTVPVAQRFSSPLNAERAKLDTQAKVLYAPDGMNNFANYLEPQAQFNLYNFTHWSQIDVLNWFAGTADKTVQIPARPWVETAHKNGVKVIGSIFLGVARWGGSADTVEALLEQDEQGHFVLADKLIAIAKFYGFDGWLMNQETDLTAVKDANNQLLEGQVDAERGKLLAAKMLAFMQYLTANAGEGMEIHWYDSMIGSGEVRWQNQLNALNQDYLQNNNITTSDAIFLNYWWDGEMIKQSQQRAIALGRSPYDVYVGVDLWPERNAQRAFSRYEWLDDLFVAGKALGSIALFAPNVNFNFDGVAHTPAFSQFHSNAADERRFYASEQRLFNGNDLNLSVNDQGQWPGISRYLPAKSSLKHLPFVSHFNTGQGRHYFNHGQQQSGAWTDMQQQDVLPTWQFALPADNSVEAFYDFDQGWQGGSSLAFSLSEANQASNIPLYATAFTLIQNSRLQVIAKTNNASVSVRLTDTSGQQHEFELKAKDDDNWQQFDFALGHLAYKTISRISVLLAGKNGSVHLGQVAILE